ncbi:MAG: N-acetylmuramoyl-L-alanine amidase [Oscillospiraceae bacterium]|nr:N-acetylmuramoyl-L-alanine amidase [Oscillospiraceae bacterium]
MALFKRVLFIAFAAVFPAYLAFYLTFPDCFPAFSSTPSTRPVLVIDAGHGGEDGGAISPSGVLESHLNLAIAKRADLLCGLFGAPSVMLRQQDISLHDPKANTLREKKVSDLHNRVELVMQQGNGVLLSIHQNSFPSEKYSGAQVFFAPTKGSQSLAEAMQITLRTVVEPSNSRQAAAISKSVYLLNHVSCPAILIECGFLTNPTEERKLQDSNYQTKLAAAILGCWLQYSNGQIYLDRDEGTA